jgi:hypothetical protein
MMLRLISKTERLNVYCLRFIVAAGEERYAITPTKGNDRSIEFTFKKDGVFGGSTDESAVADNQDWFAALVVGEDWSLQRVLEKN